ALDYLLYDAILDIFSIERQHYRVSDEWIGSFNGGSYREGQDITTTMPSGQEVVIRSQPLRDALNTMNDTLSSASEAPSVSAMMQSLGRDNRYTGIRIKVGERSVDAVEFTYASKKSVAKVGFIVDDTGRVEPHKVQIAFVMLDNKLLYSHRAFSCRRYPYDCY